MKRLVGGRAIAAMTITIAFLASPGRVAAAAPQSGAPGQPAPAVRLSSADGSVLSLADLKGRVVLVDFWASWCAPCRRSFPALDRLYVNLKSRGFEVIAVNLDERRQDAVDFLVARPHETTVVFDPEGASARAFGLAGMPTSFLIDREGRIRFVHVGYTDKVLDAYRREIEQLLTEPSAEGNR
ncbi:MAG TPA: TlpA disulfide reductase family protein [Vicinamibacterales bacterium]|jgi:thiol-disulfide isomerase/thioredoxin